MSGDKGGGLVWLTNGDSGPNPFALEEEGVRDELGLGALGDLYANLLFPHFTVLLTRARYFFLAAAAGELAIDSSKPATRPGDPDHDEEEFTNRWRRSAILRWHELEVKLRDRLMANKDGGVIGIQKYPRYLKSKSMYVLSRYLPCMRRLDLVEPLRGYERYFKSWAETGATDWLDVEFSSAAKDARKALHAQGNISLTLTQKERAWFKSRLSRDGALFPASMLKVGKETAAAIQKEGVEVSLRMLSRESALKKWHPHLRAATHAAHAVHCVTRNYQLMKQSLEKRRTVPLSQIAKNVTKPSQKVSFKALRRSILDSNSRLGPRALQAVDFIEDMFNEERQDRVSMLRRIAQRENDILGSPTRSKKPTLKLTDDKNGISRGPGWEKSGLDPADIAGTVPGFRLHAGLRIMGDILDE